MKRTHLHKLFALSLAALMALFLTRIAAAQVLYGSVVGSVTDSTGAAVSGATVTITHKETGQAREITTDGRGKYEFPTVQAGAYTIRVSRTGFKTTSKDNVVVTLNNFSRADLVMQVGEVTETVVITAESAQLKSDRAEVSAELTSRPLRDLPVPLGRNYQNLFKTLPGFTPPADAHSIPSNPSRSLVFNVNGASRSSNNTRIDGASSTNLWLPHVTAYVPALESIETVNVVSNSFDAEQGLAGGAAINVQIKSGTNEFHGSAFEYHNNQHLNAKNFFFPANQKLGKVVYNQFGGTLGGPIIKNKLFFFASYENTLDRRNAERSRLDVPTALMRTGDLRAAPQPVYDPFDANGAVITDPSKRQIISCNGVQNVICPNRINPIAAKIIGLIPQPNLPNSSGVIGDTDNYFTSAPFQFDRWTLDTKINWTVNEKFNLFGRYSHLDFFTFNETTFGPGLQGQPIAGGNPGTGAGTTKSFSVGGVYTFTPNFVVDANFGYVRMYSGVAQSDIDKTTSEILGINIPGTNGSKDYEGGLARFNISGFERYGITEAYMPYYRDDPQFQYVVNANWTKGSHNIRFGSDIYIQHLNHTQPEFLGTSFGARGGFDFGSGPTQLCTKLNANGTCGATSRSSQYNSWATFLLGLPTQLGRLALFDAPYTTRNRAYSFYGRDQWQVNNKLTLSLGTRWEYFPVPTRADRGLERYNPATNKVEIGGVGSVPEDLGVKVSKGLFAPRIGLAYRITPTFVARAGYGITNDPYALARPMRTNHPVLLNLVEQSPNSLSWVRPLEQGISAIKPADLGNGIIDVPGNVGVVTLPDDFKRGYIQSWNLTLQKELWGGFVGEIGYVATRQVRQLGLIELNWADIGTGNAGRQLNQQFKRTAETRLVAPVGGSHYDSMQVRLNRRFRDFYQLDANYTWSKSITDAGVDDSDNGLRINIPQFYHLNRALSNFDRTHNLQITNMIELPFGKGRRWLSDNGALSWIVGGWQINNIFSFQSGTPFNVTAPGTSLNAPASSQRADKVKPDVAITKTIFDAPWFDTSAFAQVTEARFGTAAWNLLRGPGFANWDFGVFRQFRITETVNLQFRAEAFNFTNTPHFNAPNGSASSTSFGKITSARGDQRQLRFGLRLGF
ncbi:MAG: TonB-dependent receptor [Blastocatellales bacterium]